MRSRLYFDEQVVFIQPVANVPQTCPDAQARQHPDSRFTSPRKQQLDERLDDGPDEIGSSDMEENIDEDAVHANHNKEPCTLFELFFHIDEPVAECKGQYCPAAAGKHE